MINKFLKAGKKFSFPEKKPENVENSAKSWKKVVKSAKKVDNFFLAGKKVENKISIEQWAELLTSALLGE